MIPLAGGIRRWVSLALLLGMALRAETARADFLDLWLEAPAKGRLVVVRQTPDFSRGFDLFQVVELDTKKGKVVQTTPLADKDRARCIATGQFEVYQAARDKARRKLEKEYVKSGYAVPAGIWSNEVPGRRTLVLESGGNRLLLSLSAGKSGPSLELSVPGKPAVALETTELLSENGDDRPAASAVSFSHVLVARRGRLLVVVVREMPVPAPEHFPKDRLFIVPLSEPLKSLGIDGPLKNSVISLP